MRVSSYEIVSDITANGARMLTYRWHYDDGSVDINTMPTDETLDADLYLTAVMQRINDRLQKLDDAELAANNFELPITTRQFLDLIPQSDRVALRVAATNIPALDDAIKYLEAGDLVYRGKAETWLGQLVTAGLMTQAQFDGIFDAWTANYG